MATKAIRPRALVEGATIEELAEAMMAGRDPFGFGVVDGISDFICPECHSTTAHGTGTAVVCGPWHWKCQYAGCRHTGTRYVLERLVLENSALLDSLYKLSGDDAA